MTIIDTPAVSTATKIELTPAQIEAIASVAVAAAGPREVTPIIQTVNVSTVDGFLQAVATDRYRVARVTFPVTEILAESVSIPVALIVGFAKQLKASKTNATMPTSVITIDGQRVELSDWSAGITVMGALTVGNFPPVARLFPDTYSEGVSNVALRISLVADAAKLRHPALHANDYTNGAMRFRFTQTANPNKPGPVVIDRHGIKETEGACEYMVQPNLILR